MAVNPLTGTTRKPLDAYGVCIASQVGGEKPASAEAMADKKFSVAPYRTYRYPPEKKGLSVYDAICYENKKGEKGEWSDVESLVIG